MITPTDRLYFKEHIWIKTISKTEAIIGLTDFAQSELGEIVFIDVPDVGKSFQQEDSFGLVAGENESWPLFMPLAGEILAFNDKLKDSPVLLNSDPLGEGWLARISITHPEELARLLSAAEYDDFVNYLNKIIG